MSRGGRESIKRPCKLAHSRTNTEEAHKAAPDTFSLCLASWGYARDEGQREGEWEGRIDKRGRAGRRKGTDKGECSILMREMPHPCHSRTGCGQVRCVSDSL